MKPTIPNLINVTLFVCAGLFWFNCVEAACPKDIRQKLNNGNLNCKQLLAFPIYFESCCKKDYLQFMDDVRLEMAQFLDPNELHSLAQCSSSNYHLASDPDILKQALERQKPVNLGKFAKVPGGTLTIGLGPDAFRATNGDIHNSYEQVLETFEIQDGFVEQEAWVKIMGTNPAIKKISKAECGNRYITFKGVGFCKGEILNAPIPQWQLFEFVKKLNAQVSDDQGYVYSLVDHAEQYTANQHNTQNESKTDPEMLQLSHLAFYSKRNQGGMYMWEYDGTNLPKHIKYSDFFHRYGGVSTNLLTAIRLTRKKLSNNKTNSQNEEKKAEFHTDLPD